MSGLIPVCDVCRKDDATHVEVNPDNAMFAERFQPRQRKVTSLDDVKVGDHVAWHRDYAIWHHAIVTDVMSRDQKMTVVHYAGALKKYEGHFASVREEDIEVNLKKDGLFVIDYDGCTFDPVDTIARARRRLGEHRYNAVKRNCEHFAHWWKTGEEFSNQAKSFLHRIWKAGGAGLSGGIREGVVIACQAVLEGLSPKKVLKVGFRSGLDRVKGCVGGVGPLAVLKGGAIAFDVFLNFAVEAGIFGYNAFKAYQKHESKEITKERFQRERCQAGLECAGGFLGALGGGYLGQMAIPVPFLGNLIGCTLGTLIGRFLGLMIGKQIADNYIDK